MTEINEPIEQPKKQRNGNGITHLNLQLGDDPLVITPVNRFGIPIAKKNLVFLLGFYSCDDPNKTSVNVSYIGEGRIQTCELVKRKKKEELRSKVYHNLDYTVERLKKLFENITPIEIVENTDPLVLFSKDEFDNPDYSKFSLLYFGKKYPGLQKPRLGIKYLGQLIVTNFDEARGLEERFSELIVRAYDKLDLELYKRYQRQIKRKERKNGKGTFNGGNGI